MSRCFRLPRRARLSDPQAIAAILLSSPALRGRWLAVRRADNSVGFARLLIRVANRFQRSAVERNRIRRSIRECFRLQRARLVAADYSISLRAPVAAGAARELRLEFERLLRLDK